MATRKEPQTDKASRKPGARASRRADRKTPARAGASPRRSARKGGNRRLGEGVNYGKGQPRGQTDTSSRRVMRSEPRGTGVAYGKGMPIENPNLSGGRPGGTGAMGEV